VVRTSGEWLDDLWVIRENRGCGVGQRLLALGEAEIIARGYETLHLRVVQSNAAAIEFISTTIGGSRAHSPMRDFQ